MYTDNYMVIQCGLQIYFVRLNLNEISKVAVDKDGKARDLKDRLMDKDHPPLMCTMINIREFFNISNTKDGMKIKTTRHKNC